MTRMAEFSDKESIFGYVTGSCSRGGSFSIVFVRYDLGCRNREKCVPWIPGLPRSVAKKLEWVQRSAGEVARFSSTTAEGDFDQNLRFSVLTNFTSRHLNRGLV